MLLQQLLGQWIDRVGGSLSLACRLATSAALGSSRSCLAVINANHDEAAARTIGEWADELY